MEIVVEKEKNEWIRKMYMLFFYSTIMEKMNGQTPKNGVVFDTTSNVQPI